MRTVILGRSASSDEKFEMKILVLQRLTWNTVTGFKWIFRFRAPIVDFLHNRPTFDSDDKKQISEKGILNLLKFAKFGREMLQSTENIAKQSC